MEVTRLAVETQFAVETQLAVDHHLAVEARSFLPAVEHACRLPVGLSILAVAVHLAVAALLPQPAVAVAGDSLREIRVLNVVADFLHQGALAHRQKT